MVSIFDINCMSSFKHLTCWPNYSSTNLTWSNICFYNSNSFFLKYQCGLCKGYSTQNWLLAMIKEMMEPHDGNKVYTAVLLNFSKIFHCLLHNLLIAKLHLFDYKSLAVVHTYLSDRVRIKKINSFTAT